MNRGHHLVAAAAAAVCRGDLGNLRHAICFRLGRSDHLTRGQRLTAGQELVRITNTGARTWLVMQANGNLVPDTTGVLVGSRHTCWASKTVHSGSFATYQSDNNFVVHNAANRRAWASGTQNDDGSTVNINGFGQLWAGLKAISSFCD